jgi:hypothetical protein
VQTPSGFSFWASARPTPFQPSPSEDKPKAPRDLPARDASPPSGGSNSVPLPSATDWLSLFAGGVGTSMGVIPLTCPQYMKVRPEIFAKANPLQLTAKVMMQEIVPQSIGKTGQLGVCVVLKGSLDQLSPDTPVLNSLVGFGLPAPFFQQGLYGRIGVAMVRNLDDKDVSSKKTAVKPASRGQFFSMASTRQSLPSGFDGFRQLLADGGTRFRLNPPIPGFIAAVPREAGAIGLGTYLAPVVDKEFTSKYVSNPMLSKGLSGWGVGMAVAGLTQPFQVAAFNRTLAIEEGKKLGLTKLPSYRVMMTDYVKKEGVKALWRGLSNRGVTIPWVIMMNMFTVVPVLERLSDSSGRK